MKKKAAHSAQDGNSQARRGTRKGSLEKVLCPLERIVRLAQRGCGRAIMIPAARASRRWRQGSRTIFREMDLSTLAVSIGGGCAWALVEAGLRAQVWHGFGGMQASFRGLSSAVLTVAPATLTIPQGAATISIRSVRGGHGDDVYRIFGDQGRVEREEVMADEKKTYNSIEIPIGRGREGGGPGDGCLDYEP